MFSEIDNCLGIYWVDFTIKDIFPVDDVLTKIEHKDNTYLDVFQLKQNYPNPFNGKTSIEFQIGHSGFIKLQIFDSRGRLVKKLVNENLSKGNYQLNLNMKDFSSGLYYYQLQSDKTILSKPMIYIK